MTMHSPHQSKGKKANMWLRANASRFPQALGVSCLTFSYFAVKITLISGKCRKARKISKQSKPLTLIALHLSRRGD
jgi:hypothetical protein